MLIVSRGSYRSGEPAFPNLPAVGLPFESLPPAEPGVARFSVHLGFKV